MTFNSDEICKILTACSTLNIQELTLGEAFKAVFYPASQPKEFLSGNTTIVPTPPTAEETIPRPEESQTSEVLPEQEMMFKEDELSLMQIENPARYEELLLNGELEDDGRPEETD